VLQRQVNSTETCRCCGWVGFGFKMLSKNLINLNQRTGTSR